MEKKTIEINIDEQIFDDAQNIYKKLGLSVNDAIKLFLNQTVLFRGLPISLRIPENEDTREPVLEQTPETAQIQNVAEQEISAPKEPAAESVPQEQSVMAEEAASASPAATGEDGASTGSAATGKKSGSIVDDEEENTDTPTHLFDGWNSSDGK